MNSAATERPRLPEPISPMRTLSFAPRGPCAAPRREVAATPAADAARSKNFRRVSDVSRIAHDGSSDRDDSWRGTKSRAANVRNGSTFVARNFSRATARPSERKPNLRLNRSHRLGARHGAEAGIARCQTVRIDLPIRQVLRISHRLIGRAVQLQLRDAPAVDDGVQRVERVEAQLNLPRAPEPDIPGQRQVERVIRTARHVVAARLEAQASSLRSRERRDVELPVLIVRAALSRIADDADHRRVAG